MASMARVLTPTLLAVLLLAPSGASADPLLSGYGGPGGGEQVVLGSSLIGGSGGGSGGSGGSSASGSTDSLRAVPAPAAQAQAPAASGSSSGTAPRRSGTGRRSGAKRSGSATRPKRPATSAPAATHVPTALATGAPPVRAYPSRASAAGGLPLSPTDLLICALALVALSLVGSGLRRLSNTLHDDSASAQATAR